MKGPLKFAVYILLKWTLFYVYQFTGGSTRWSFDKVNGEGFFLATFMLIALPLVELVVLFFPLQLALRLKGWITTLILILVFGLEFVIGWFATNQNFEDWMAVKVALSVVLFVVMYRKQLTM